MVMRLVPAARVDHEVEVHGAVVAAHVDGELDRPQRRHVRVERDRRLDGRERVAVRLGEEQGEDAGRVRARLQDDVPAPAGRRGAGDVGDGRRDLGVREVAAQPVDERERVGIDARVRGDRAERGAGPRSGRVRPVPGAVPDRDGVQHRVQGGDLDVRLRPGVLGPRVGLHARAVERDGRRPGRSSSAPGTWPSTVASRWTELASITDWRLRASISSGSVTFSGGTAAARGPTPTAPPTIAPTASTPTRAATPSNGPRLATRSLLARPPPSRGRPVGP